MQLGSGLLRDSEIAGLKRTDIVLKSTRPGMNITGKGSKERFVPFEYFPTLHGVLIAEISKFGNNSYIVHKSNGEPYTRSGIAKLFIRGSEKLGLNNMNPHFLSRHVGISQLLLNGVPLKIVSKIAGHAHPATTVKEYFHGQAYLAYRILKGSHLYNDLFSATLSHVSVKDAAERLEVGVRNAQYLCKNGELKATKNMGDWLICESDIFEYILRRDGICCL